MRMPRWWSATWTKRVTMTAVRRMLQVLVGGSTAPPRQQTQPGPLVWGLCLGLHLMTRMKMTTWRTSTASLPQ